MPQASVAIQVRVMTVVPKALTVVVSLWVIVTAPEQLSVAVADPVAPISVGEPQVSCLLEGQVITGAVVSTTVIVWLAVLLLPHKSIAVQVLFTTLEFAQAPAVVTSAKVNVAVPQASVAVGVANTGTAGHSIVLGAGRALITGAVVSTTVIV